MPLCLTIDGTPWDDLLTYTHSFRQATYSPGTVWRHYFRPSGIVTTPIVPNNTYIGVDGTDSGVDESVTSLTRLLVRLDFTGQSPLPPVLGETFTVELVPSPNNFFLDSDFNDMTYQTTTGAVQVVPESASITLLLTGVPAVLIWLRRRIAIRHAVGQNLNEPALRR